MCNEHFVQSGCNCKSKHQFRIENLQPNNDQSELHTFYLCNGSCPLSLWHLFSLEKGKINLNDFKFVLSIEFSGILYSVAFSKNSRIISIISKTRSDI